MVLPFVEECQCKDNKYKIIKLCQASKDDLDNIKLHESFDDNEDDDSYDSDDSDYRYIEDYKCEPLHRCNEYMMIIGTISNKISEFMNDEVSNNFELDISDYQYPFRNKLIIENMLRGNILKSAESDFAQYIVNVMRIIIMAAMNMNHFNLSKIKQEFENPALGTASKIVDHEKEFKTWKIRINDLIDPSLLPSYIYDDHYLNLGGKANDYNDFSDNIDDDDDDDIASIYTYNYYIPAIFTINHNNGNICINSEIKNLILIIIKLSSFLSLSLSLSL